MGIDKMGGGDILVYNKLRRKIMEKLEVQKEFTSALKEYTWLLGELAHVKEKRDEARAAVEVEGKKLAMLANSERIDSVVAKNAMEDVKVMSGALEEAQKIVRTVESKFDEKKALLKKCAETGDLDLKECGIEDASDEWVNAMAILEDAAAGDMQYRLSTINAYESSKEWASDYQRSSLRAVAKLIENGARAEKVSEEIEIRLESQSIFNGHFKSGEKALPEQSKEELDEWAQDFATRGHNCMGTSY